MKTEILVVDDERQLLMGVHEVLERKGYSVTTAADGLEALKRLGEREYQLMISDVRMPHMDGMALLQRVQQTAPQTPIVLLTAFGTVENAVEAMKLGARDYLLKPFTSTQLLEVVERQARRPPSSAEGRLAESRSPQMQDLVRRAQQAARSEATVLIQAESGTGKELLARFIHAHSPRTAGPFVAVNCAAMPETLLESELFGHEKGAFSGAISAKPGKFELARAGTLLLDEISEMLPLLQAKLLRVIQEREMDRVGSVRPTPVDVRIISTTNRKLCDLVAEGAFREDLYYRLNVIPLSIPPLRDRKEDIAGLVEWFCRKCDLGGKRVFSRETIELLTQYDWPGNVRELENIVFRTLVLSRDPVIQPRSLFLDSNDRAEARSGPCSLRDMEKRLILDTLKATHGNRTRAAEILDISVRTLRNKLKEYAAEE